ncbi:MAG: hypothetical protein KDC13_10110, partial [Bacteroidetes bacterium]|nr:hypothetical protein [Bacteroidota bacterium]
MKQDSKQFEIIKVDFRQPMLRQTGKKCESQPELSKNLHRPYRLTVLRFFLLSLYQNCTGMIGAATFLFEQIAENSLFPRSLINSSGELVYINQAFCDLLGKN